MLTMLLTGHGKYIFIAIAATAAGLGLFVSATSFIAHSYASLSERILDDAGTEELDMVDLSEETLPVYASSIEALEKAIVFDPLHSSYRSLLADRFTRVDVWYGTMRLIGEDIAGTISKENGLRGRSLTSMQRALLLDPSNPQLYLSSGRQLIALGEVDLARKRLLQAAERYPINSPTRYAVAVGLFALGYREIAREQAVILARNDDSYRLDDDDPMTAVARNQLTPAYEYRLMNSYLYKALEIVFQAGPKDAALLCEIIPDHVDARAVSQRFLAHKGLL
jgi:tetratricopeptide (TPR) repeat protein